jgi:hypothetical protein
VVMETTGQLACRMVSSYSTEHSLLAETIDNGFFTVKVPWEYAIIMQTQVMWTLSGILSSGNHVEHVHWYGRAAGKVNSHDIIDNGNISVLVLVLLLILILILILPLLWIPLALGVMNRLAHRSLTRQSHVWKSHF